MRIDLKTQRRILPLVSLVFIIFVLFCSKSALASPNWLPSPSDSLATSPSVGALYVDGRLPWLVYVNATPTEDEGSGDIQGIVPLYGWSAAAAVLGTIIAIASVVYYRRRDPIIIDDEPFEQSLF
jgi:hypothetical protein